jgi:hypothetical protein
MFFFEKKNQKTFSHKGLVRQRALPDKSFLLLFFKKEVLSSFAHRIESHSCLTATMLTVLVLVLAAPALARASPFQDSAQMCEQAITKAELAGKTPPGMLAAIGQVESGRLDPQTGGMRTWPWTINAEGNGQFFPTKALAVAAVAALQAAGVRSIDVGCMQVNLMYHPDAFRSLDQAFDPAANAAYAVRFLNALYRRTGDWPKTIAAYHSLTPDIADGYQHRVLVTWQQHVPTAVTPVPPIGGPTYMDSGMIYGAFGSTGRVYGMIIPGPWKP